MGQLRKRGGVWWLRYYRNGKRYEESSRSGKREDAVRLLRQREGDVAKGLPISPLIARYTFDEGAKNIEREYAANERRSAPWVTRRLRRHLLPFFQGRRMSSITTNDVRSYCESRSSSGAARATINRELSLLKRMFSLAVNDGTLLAKPHIPMLSENNVRKGFFEREQLDAVCAHLSPVLQSIVKFAYLTGWRVPSEILILQWRQVDFDAGVIRLEPGTTKNREARVFPFDASPELRALLIEQRCATDAVERRTNSIVPYVFHRNGKPVRRFEGAWTAACSAEGCPGMLKHDFRRTAVRNLSRAGVPDTIAMKLTGHKTRSIYDRYNIVSEADLRAAVERVSERATGTFSGTVVKNVIVKPFTPTKKI